LAALHGCKIHVGKNATSDPHWIAFGRIDIAAGSILSESALMAGRLLQEILFEGRIRWRYLALYRVFEAAYLIGLKETLLASFLDAPKDALSQAQEALASELALFKKLVEDKGLTARFELLRAMVDQDTSNRFLHAIKRSLRKSGSAGPMKGVEYAYKIRCAIVHAGQHDVVFDRFDDGENGVDLLLKTLEEAVFELLGLRGS
jgi:hypothetical protein